ncbi:methyltransferase [Alicyclobacillus cellulosilyticus]|uniref:Putative 4-hydroxy-4-methyl-2-oxoglutarate aldolase n=1 Tax=Alicyclobacillus cellulosilyticus TaxID=1003997 RepID=A0A917KBX6_9BACL|nr:RraA family protein [Alicyclobacillus cellulosilyticus]GGJ08300.1 methyltransferase [Alicyclobacillus cellulosilyticus]
MKIGLRVLQPERRPPQSILEAFREIPAACVSDNLHRLYAVSGAIRPYHKAGKLVGSAFTVKTRPGDNLFVHKALDMAQPGDVLVVDAGGDVTQAVVGEIMLRLAQWRGLAGFVVDGAIRDAEAFAQEAFPVYARGVTHRGPYKTGPGEINVPVAVGGVVVAPGDIVLGDADGVVVVPLDLAERVLHLARQQMEHEAATLRAIADGTVDRSWVDRTIQEMGWMPDVTRAQV